MYRLVHQRQAIFEIINTFIIKDKKTAKFYPDSQMGSFKVRFDLTDDDALHLYEFPLWVYPITTVKS